MLFPEITTAEALSDWEARRAASDRLKCFLKSGRSGGSRSGQQSETGKTKAAHHFPAIQDRGFKRENGVRVLWE